MKPAIIKGNRYKDDRGILKFNNDFDATEVKRVYTLQNVDSDFIRSWQGHQIEQRWFSSVLGSFKIKIIEPDNWRNPSKNLPVVEFILTAKNLDILHVPAGYITSIQAMEENAILLVFADYKLDENNDEYRFPSDYFK